MSLVQVSLENSKFHFGYSIRQVKTLRLTFNGNLISPGFSHNISNRVKADIAKAGSKMTEYKVCPSFVKFEYSIYVPIFQFFLLEF